MIEPDSLAKAVQDIGTYSRTLGEETTRYWQLHENRFIWTAKLIGGLLGKRSSTERILDVGNSFQTLLFEKLFPDTEIDTLGFLDHRYRAQKNSRHYEFDLNLCHDPQQWPQPQAQYDVISFLEVIEHLYTSPTQVLAFLRTFLKDDGLLLIQTPNAAALKKRVKLLFGKNPYERIRENRQNPGHFREYTAKEISDMASKCGYATTLVRYNSFLIDGNRSDRRMDRIARWLPATFKGGFTMILQPEKETSRWRG